MNVGSYLEVYTVHYGLGLYNMFWTVLSGTGLALWPFLKMIYDNWRKPAESSSSEAPGSLQSLQGMKWSLFFKVFMLAMAVMPLSTLATSNTAYVSRCGDQVHATYSYGNTGTTYDNTMQAPLNNSGGSSAPILLNLVLKISYGINSYVSANLPCMADIREIDRAMHNIYIDDQELKTEFNQFNAMCYLPAKSKYIRSLEGSGDPMVDDFYREKYQAFTQAGGNSGDIENMDSVFLRETPGLYAICTNNTDCRNTLQSTQPVTGWSHDAFRDAGMSPEQIAADQGQPYCGEWWASLRHRLYDGGKLRHPVYDKSIGGLVRSAKEGWLSLFKNALTYGADEDELISLTIAALQRSDRPNMMGRFGDNPGIVRKHIADTFDSHGSFANWLGIGGGAVAFTSFSMIPGVGDVTEHVVGEIASGYVNMYLVKKAAPMMKTLLLMLIICLMPIYLVIGEYEIDRVITGLLLIMIVNMFDSIFEIARYLESTLFAAMYPNVTVLGSIASQGVQPLILDYMLMAFYLIGPALMLYMVQMAGQSISTAGKAGDGATASVGGMGGQVGGSLSRGAGNLSRAGRGAVKGKR